MRDTALAKQLADYAASQFGIIAMMNGDMQTVVHKRLRNTFGHMIGRDRSERAARRKRGESR